MGEVLLAVNGTLMRGLKLEPNMQAAGASFVREANTRPEYRLWTIGQDEHPAMQKVLQGGVAVALEVWSVPEAGLISILKKEPQGLCIGLVTLEDNSVVLGVLGEAWLCESRGKEISRFGGWRKYMDSKEK